LWFLGVADDHVVFLVQWLQLLHIYEEYCLQGYNAMRSGRSVLTFKRNILSLASEVKNMPCNQQAEQATLGKHGSDVDHRRRARKRVMLP
jgi:hypothetical protein